MTGDIEKSPLKGEQYHEFDEDNTELSLWMPSALLLIYIERGKNFTPDR